MGRLWVRISMRKRRSPTRGPRGPTALAFFILPLLLRNFFPPAIDLDRTQRPIKSNRGRQTPILPVASILKVIPRAGVGIRQGWSGP
jgi:hypothetical protein